MFLLTTFGSGYCVITMLPVMADETTTAQPHPIACLPRPAPSTIDRLVLRRVLTWEYSQSSIDTRALKACVREHSGHPTLRVQKIPRKFCAPNIRISIKININITRNTSSKTIVLAIRLETLLRALALKIMISQYYRTNR